MEPLGASWAIFWGFTIKRFMHESYFLALRRVWEGFGRAFGSIFGGFGRVWDGFWVHFREACRGLDSIFDFGGADRKKPNSCLNLCIFGFRSIFWISFSWICLGFGMLGVFVGFGRLRCSNTLLTGVC